MLTTIAIALVATAFGLALGTVRVVRGILDKGKAKAVAAQPNMPRVFPNKEPSVEDAAGEYAN